MRLEIITPEDYLGPIVGDLQQRRAMIEKSENRGAAAMVVAHAPLKELFGYSSEIRSLFESNGLTLHEWEKARTDRITLRETTLSADQAVA